MMVVMDELEAVAQMGTAQLRAQVARTPPVPSARSWRSPALPRCIDEPSTVVE